MTESAERETHVLGMWCFLAAEIVFFGAGLGGFLVLRSFHLRDFMAASNHTHLGIGAANTAILLTSSLTMALAVRADRGGRRPALLASLAATLILGAVFLVVKAVEWAMEIREGLLPGPGFRIEGVPAPTAQLFFASVFTLTGLHALHLLIGVGMVGIFLGRALFERGWVGGRPGIEIGGLYWHFVDLVWIFLYPMLYLLGRHQPHV